MREHRRQTARLSHTVLLGGLRVNRRDSGDLRPALT